MMNSNSNINSNIKLNTASTDAEIKGLGAREAVRLVCRSRVWFVLRQGKPVAIATLPALVGLPGLDATMFGFVDWWVRRGIVRLEDQRSQGGRSRKSLVLVRDLGPRPPSWRGDYDPNCWGPERDGSQRLWNVLRIARSGVGAELFRLAGVGSRVGVRLLRAWMRAGLVRVDLVGVSGKGGRSVAMASVVLMRDLGGVAPVVLLGRVYDPNADELIVVADV